MTATIVFLCIILITIISPYSCTSYSGPTFDVYFGDHTPFGMQLDDKLYITAINTGGVAQTHGVMVSDRLIAINGKIVTAMSLNHVVKELRNGSIPMKLTLESMIPLQSRPYYVSTAEEALSLTVNASMTKPTRRRRKVMPDIFEGINKIVQDKQGELRLLGADDQSYSFVYARAEFGPYTSCEAFELVISNPIDGCTLLKNSKNMKNKYVVVERGGCTFLEKATLIQTAGASGLIVINAGSRGIIEMPAGGSSLASTITMPSVMISSDTAETLNQLLNQGQVLAQLAATNDCNNEEDSRKLQDRLEENKAKERLTEAYVYNDTRAQAMGGQIKIIYPNHEIKMIDYLQAQFGGSISSPRLNKFIMSNPLNGCYPLVNTRRDVIGRIVVVEKGGCNIEVKVKNIQSAGGVVVLVINNEAGIEHMTLQSGNDKGILIPVLMISKTSGGDIRRSVQLYNSDVTLEILPDQKIVSIWRELHNLMIPQNWPREEKKLTKFYRKQTLIYHPDISSGNIERFEFLNVAYVNAKDYIKENIEMDIMMDFEYNYNDKDSMFHF